MLRRMAEASRLLTKSSKWSRTNPFICSGVRVVGMHLSSDRAVSGRCRRREIGRQAEGPSDRDRYGACQALRLSRFAIAHSGAMAVSFNTAYVKLHDGHPRPDHIPRLRRLQGLLSSWKL